MCLGNGGYYVLAAANRAEAVQLSRNFPGEIPLLITQSDEVAETISAQRPETCVFYLPGAICMELTAIVRKVNPVRFQQYETLPAELRNKIREELAECSDRPAGLLRRR
jgi:hypothetical protein